MGKPSAPSAPDPYATAGAQYNYGIKAAGYNTALNDVNTQGPTGSTNYAVTGFDPNTGAPIRTQTTTLSPAEQAILNKSQGVQSGELGAAGNFLGQVGTASGAGEPGIPGVKYGAAGGPIQGSINTSGVPGIINSNDAYNYGQSTALKGEMAALDPSLTQDREQLDASLRNSGAVPGTPAYDNAMSRLDASQAGARAQAGSAAISAGNTLQNTQYGESANTNEQLFTQAQAEMAARNAAEGQGFGQNVENVGLNNQGGQTALADYAQKVGIPLNELTSILSNSQVNAPSPSAPASSNVGSPDIMSAFQNKYAGQLSKYNAGVASSNATTSDAASLGALALMFMSDERLKKDIEQVGHTPGGLPAYMFRYKGSPPKSAKQLGVMAQDVEKVDPAAVHHTPDGYKMVDYARVT